MLRQHGARRSTLLLHGRVERTRPFGFSERLCGGLTRFSEEARVGTLRRAEKARLSACGCECTRVGEEDAAGVPVSITEPCGAHQTYARLIHLHADTECRVDPFVRALVDRFPIDVENP